MSMDVPYLLKVCICITFFYVLYSLFFRMTTFFTANRLYLLTGLILPFIIPLLQLSSYVPDIHVIPTEYLTVLRPVSIDDSATYDAISEKPYSLVDLLRIFYWIGFTWMLCSLVRAIVKISLLKKRSIVEQKDGTTLVFMAAGPPFSFFNWIFLPVGDVNDSIVEHEHAHVRQRHWIDLLMIEIVHCILWFNPILIFYKRALKLQHEYLADASTLKRGVNLSEYLHCLLRQIATASGVNAASYFSSQTVKKRIIMMTTNQTSRKFFALYLLAFPLVGLLLFSFSTPVHWDNTVTNLEDTQIALVVDAGHGGSDAGGLSSHGASEKEITLSMAKILKTLGQEQGLAVVLTRSDDKAMTLQERVDLSRKVKAVAFISLHLNSHQNSTQSGIECYVNKDAKDAAENLRLATALTGQLQELKGMSVNGIKEGNFFVLKEARNPAVILELGFLTNEGDYNFLKEVNNQRMICNKIIAGVKQFAK